MTCFSLQRARPQPTNMQTRAQDQGPINNPARQITNKSATAMLLTDDCCHVLTDD